jgi:hypothetical protein
MSNPFNPTLHMLHTDLPILGRETAVTARVSRDFHNASYLSQEHFFFVIDYKLGLMFRNPV